MKLSALRQVTAVVAKRRPGIALAVTRVLTQRRLALRRDLPRARIAWLGPTLSCPISTAPAKPVPSVPLVHSCTGCAPRLRTPSASHACLAAAAFPLFMAPQPAPPAARVLQDNTRQARALTRLTLSAPFVLKAPGARGAMLQWRVLQELILPQWVLLLPPHAPHVGLENILQQ